MSYDIIILGAGVSGLTAAMELSKAGYSVLILEARNRIGGRIHDITDTATGWNIALGAEFVHGDLPLTNALLHKAGLTATSTQGKFYKAEDGLLSDNEDGLDIDWPQLLERMESVPQDMPLAAFLNEYYPGAENEKNRQQVARYVSGYDAADVAFAGTKGMLLEWQQEDEAQSRPTGGYRPLLQYIEQCCRDEGCIIALSTIVCAVSREGSGISVACKDGRSFSASKALCTLPLGVLQADAANAGSVRFSFLPEACQKAIRQLRFGAVVKLILVFKSAFWKDTANDIGFVLSDERIPTWWTQLPGEETTLTGWLAGPESHRLDGMQEEQIIHLALESLASVFKKESAFLKTLLTSCHCRKWNTDPFARGAYSYPGVGREEALKILREPAAGLLYFAGEHMYDGASAGTVEAAIASGFEVAGKILDVRNAT